MSQLDILRRIFLLLIVVSPIATWYTFLRGSNSARIQALGEKNSSSPFLPPLRRRPTVYLHIPKAGGTALTSILDQCLEQLNLKRCRVGKGTSFDHVCERPSVIIQTTLHNIQSEFIPRTSSLENTECQFLHIHYDYSLLEWMDEQRKERGVHDVQFDTITMLRNPIDREISAWKFQSLYDEQVGNSSLYIQAERKYSIRKQNRSHCFDTGDLRRQKYGREHNHMTRQLAGVLWRCSQSFRSITSQSSSSSLKDKGPWCQQRNSSMLDDDNDQHPCKEEDLLDRAKANLDRLSHIFVYEEFHEIPQYLEQVYGCKNISMPTTQYQTKGRWNENLTVPNELVEELRRHNQLDLQLYEYAKTISLKRRQEAVLHSTTGNKPHQ